MCSTAGLEGAEGIPVALIRDEGYSEPEVGPLSVENTIKHELSHTYGLPDDRGNKRNSVMGLKQESTEWSSLEMEVIDMNRDLYPHKELSKFFKLYFIFDNNPS